LIKRVEKTGQHLLPDMKMAMVMMDTTVMEEMDMTILFLHTRI